MPRFQAYQLSIAQITENLKVLATFRTQEQGSSNLTIREGIFKKTTGKLNLFKGIVRDAEDSLTNKKVLDEILTNLGLFADHYLKNPNDNEYDILCNAMYGFLNLGSKYCDRNNVKDIAEAMSEVCRQALVFFQSRLDNYRSERAASYSQGVYNQANGVHLKGTCWAMVMDWARRIILKNKMGYAHNLDPLFAYDQEKLLHRGKYIAHVFGLSQSKNYPDIGAALNAMDPQVKAQTNHLLQKYYAEQKGSKRTIEQKFSRLSYQTQSGFDFGHEIHIGNQNKSINTRKHCINMLRAKIGRWIQDANSKRDHVFAHGIGFYMREKIGFTNWRITKARQQPQANNNPVNINLFGVINPVTETYRGGHELAFAYHPVLKKCYFMDPNLGEWVFDDPHRVAELIYDVLKIYTVKKEKNGERFFCREIYKTDSALFSSKDFYDQNLAKINLRKLIIF
jgi:hypothetical protein